MEENKKIRNKQKLRYFIVDKINGSMVDLKKIFNGYTPFTAGRKIQKFINKSSFNNNNGEKNKFNLIEIILFNEGNDFKKYKNFGYYEGLTLPQMKEIFIKGKKSVVHNKHIIKRLKNSRTNKYTNIYY